MFPIQDPKGRVIAFGGRALDPDQPAKYLNSPETPLFHKGHVLFNAHRARSAAHDKERIIVVEGYMDVVTLAEAGFTEAVAPLGTALTEDQLGLLWRITPEPMLCFDGDGAGQRAAFRAVDTALPHLKPGASLMFAFLPDGLDPDDLVRQQGPQAFETALARARPLSRCPVRARMGAGRLVDARAAGGPRAAIAGAGVAHRGRGRQKPLPARPREAAGRALGLRQPGSPGGAHDRGLGRKPRPRARYGRLTGPRGETERDSVRAGGEVFNRKASGRATAASSSVLTLPWPQEKRDGVRREHCPALSGSAADEDVA